MRIYFLLFRRKTRIREWKTRTTKSWSVQNLQCEISIVQGATEINTVIWRCKLQSQLFSTLQRQVR